MRRLKEGHVLADPRYAWPSALRVENGPTSLSDPTHQTQKGFGPLLHTTHADPVDQ